MSVRVVTVVPQGLVGVVGVGQWVVTGTEGGSVVVVVLVTVEPGPTLPATGLGDDMCDVPVRRVLSRRLTTLPRVWTVALRDAPLSATDQNPD